MENGVSYADLEDIEFRLECATCNLSFVHGGMTEQTGGDSTGANAVFAVVLQMRSIHEQLKEIVTEMARARKEQK